MLQRAENPSDELDTAIADVLGRPRHQFAYSRNYTIAVEVVEATGYDWIMGNVNGQVGGTPYAQVGVSDDKASYAVTSLLSLWLSFFRLRLGDERDVAAVGSQ